MTMQVLAGRSLSTRDPRQQSQTKEETSMRVIPIGRAAAAAGDDNGCDEESGVVRKVEMPLTRREFLQGSGVLFGTLASGSLLASLAPSTA
jgi:hypothetical protein